MSYRLYLLLLVFSTALQAQTLNTTDKIRLQNVIKNYCDGLSRFISTGSSNDLIALKDLFVDEQNQVYDDFDFVDGDKTSVSNYFAKIQINRRRISASCNVDLNNLDIYRATHGPNGRPLWLVQITKTVNDYRKKNVFFIDTETFKIYNIYRNLPPDARRIGKDEPAKTQTNTVTIAGQTYKTVRIGDQTWLAENLNLYVPNSYCYDNKSYNCSKYGRFYTWEAAKAAASLVLGWHLPTDEEWKTLELFLGMSQSEADDWGWRGTNEGTKLKKDGSSGMDLRLAGYRNSSGYFNDLGYYGYFWSASPNGSSYAWYRYVYHGSSNVYRDNSTRSYAFSVRLVKD